jgi:hypothetical protein
MKTIDRRFCLLSAGTALILTAIVYAPMFTGKIPFPAIFVFAFPPFAQAAPLETQPLVANIGDLVSSFYPYRTIAARAVREGMLPLWNPYMLSGAPFLANSQSALFYPPNFLYYVLSLPLAWSMGFVIRRVLAALFAALFVRRIGGTTWGAIAAGLIFSFCGFLTAWQGQAMSDAAIWLGLICYAVVRLHAKPDGRSITIAAFAFAMPVLAGHPETAAHLTLTGTALALFVFVREPRSSFIRAFAASGLLAAGLAAVQIIPTIEWLQYIYHPLKVPWPAPPLYSMLGLVSRDLIREKNSIGLLIPEQAAYLAMMTFVAAPIALLRKSSRGFAIFFAFWTAAAISAAYGIGPAHWIVQRTPVLSTLKNARLILVFSFGLAVLAGLGLSVLEEFDLANSRLRRFRAALLGFTGLTVAFLLIYVVHLVQATESIEFVRMPRFGLFFLMASAAAAGLRLAGLLDRHAFAALALLVVGADLATVSYGAMPFTKTRDVFPSIELFDRLPKPSTAPFRIAQLGAAYGANFESIYGHSALGGYELSLERLKTFLKDLSRNEMDSVMLTTDGVLETKDRRLDLLNAKYYIVSEWDPRFTEFRNQPDRFRFLYTSGDTDVYENLRTFPPEFLVPAHGAEIIPNEASQLARLKDPTFQAEQQVVLTERPQEVPAVASLVSTAKVEWTSRQANGFELDVTAGEANILVISQIDYPGWKASVDGHSVAIMRADYAFPAIFISPGAHHVRFSFEPWTFKIGLAMSALAAAIIVVIVFRGINRSNQNRL